MAGIVYTVIIAPSAVDALAAMRDKTARAKIVSKIDGLSSSPSSQGKPLRGSLSAYRSIKMARHRIIFQVVETTAPPEVHVVLVGLRKEGDKNDVYALAEKLHARGTRLISGPKQRVYVHPQRTFFGGK